MSTRTYRRSARRQRRQSASWLPIALLIFGVLLIGGSVIALTSINTAGGGSISYRAEDVAFDRPLLAVHEMGDGPPIPFLPANQPQPAITLPESSYSFGRIGPRDVVERTFVVRNSGQAPLTISRAYTTCGCTTAEISASVIPPGKLATVKLIFDAGYHDSAGQTVRRGLIIESNDPKRPQAEIWVQAAVRFN